MKLIVAGLAAAGLLLGGVAAQAAPKGTPNYYGYVPHQKTGGDHPGGHSSVTGHKKNGGSAAYGAGYGGGGGYDGGGHHGGYDGGDGKGGKGKKVATCFPPGHCKSINEGYYGPPGQRGK